MFRYFSSKQHKELFFNKPEYNIMVKYFVQNTNSAIDLFRDEIELMSCIKGFNINDIDKQILIDEHDNLISSPDRVIPLLFGFNQKVSNDYFRFFEILIEKSSYLPHFKDIVSDFFPHLIRSLTILSYQVVNGQNHYDYLNYYHLNKFHYLIISLLSVKNDLLSESTCILVPIIQFLTLKVEKISENPSILPYKINTSEIVLCFIQFFKKKPWYYCKSRHLFVFLLDFFVKSSRNDVVSVHIIEIYHEFVEFLRLFYHEIPNNIEFIEQINDICFSFMNIAAIRLSEYPNGWIKMAEDSINILKTTVGYNSQSQIEHSMDTIIQFLITLEIISPHSQENNKLIQQADELQKNVTINPYLFIECDAIEKYGSIPKCDMSLVQRLHFDFDPMVSSFYESLFDLMNLSPLVLDYIVNRLLNHITNHPNYYLEALFIKTIYSVVDNVSVSILNNSLIWKIFANSMLSHQKNEDRLNTVLFSFIYVIIVERGLDILIQIIELFNIILDQMIPEITLQVIQILNIIYSNSNEQIMGYIESSEIIDKLVFVDFSYRNYIINTGSHSEMKLSRLHILYFFESLSQKKNSIKVLFYNEIRGDYVFSLLFESKIKNIGEGIVLKAVQLFPNLNIFNRFKYILKLSFPLMFQDNWRLVVLSIINIITKAIPHNYENIVNCFVDTGSVYAFSRITLAFLAKKSVSRARSYSTIKDSDFLPLTSSSDSNSQMLNLQEMANAILLMFVKLSHSSPLMRYSLSEPINEFMNSFQTVFRRYEIKESTANLLLNLIVNEQVTLNDCKSTAQIRNIEGLKILFVATKETPLFSVFLDLLVDITKDSIFNRYQCYNSSIITNILDTISHNDCLTLYELFEIIGSSFFSISDFSQMIRLLQRTNNECVLPLINSIGNTLIRCDDKESLSFFHFSMDNTLFFLENFSLPQCFRISVKIRFGDGFHEFVEGTSMSVFELYSKTEQIKVSVSQNQLLIHFINHQNVFECHSVFEIPIGKWAVINLSYQNRTLCVNLSFNQTLFEMPLVNDCYFDTNDLTFRISRVYADFEFISFYDADSKKEIGLFAAHSVYQGISPNLISDSSLGNAKFIGMNVPLTLSLLDIIPVCGGPKVLLPLLEQISSSPTPQEFLISLLSVFIKLVKMNEKIFQSEMFFRSLGYLLTQMDHLYLTVESINLLLKLYLGLKSNELRIEMIDYIWASVTIWSELTDDLQVFVYAGIFPAIIQYDLRNSSMNFANLLISFVPKIYLKSSNSLVIQKFWILFRILSMSALSVSDISLLFGMALNSFYDLYSIEAAKLIFYFTIEKRTLLLGFLCQYSFYDPIMYFFNSPDDKIRVLALISIHNIHVYLKKQGQSNLTDFSVLSIKYYSTIGNNTYFCSELLRCIFSKEPIMTDTEEFIFDFDTPMILENPEYIPLLFSCFQFISTNDRNQMASFFVKTLEYSHESRIQFSRLEIWPFWCSFLGLLSSQNGSILGVISKIFVSIINSMGKELYRNYLFQLLAISRHFCVFNMKDFASILLNVSNVSPSKIVFDIILEFLLLPISLKDKPHGIISLHEFAQPFILESASDIEFDSNVFLNPECVSLCINCLHFLLNQDINFLNQILFSPVRYSDVMCYLCIVFSEENDPRIRNLIDQFLKLCSSSAIIFTYDPIYTLSLYFWKDKDLLKLLDTNKGGNGEKVSFKESFHNSCEPFSSSFTQYSEKFISFLSSKLSLLVSSTKENDCCLYISHNFIQIQNDVKIKNTRKLRQNKKLWKEMMKQLNGQNGGPWSTIDSIDHYKMSLVFDSIGRNIKMKRNQNFNDHYDASSLRDLQEINCAQSTPILAQTTNNIQDEEENNDVDDRIVTLQLDCNMITVSLFYYGCMILCSDSITFEASDETDSLGEEKIKSQKFVQIHKDRIKFILKRRYLHVDNSAELFTTDNKCFFFVFEGVKDRSRFFNEIRKMCPPKMQFIQTKDPMKVYNEMGIEKRWISGEMSNFEYLYWLNILSGRSYNDLSQYPIFPWVIKDYESESIDLDNPNSYRDLSKPVGALDNNRLKDLLENYNEMKSTPFPCLYRFFYSAPAYVISYLIRCEPFTSLHILLQNGRFDNPNRLFVSIDSSWKSASYQQSDFRELIPEFFCNPEFLLNSDGFDLGKLEDMDFVGDVNLPLWAESSSMFVAINRLALESDFVSDHLHEWIDLVFGYKTRGIEAEKSYNVFHPFSYHEILHNPLIESDPSLRNAVFQHAANFGIVPDQLFLTPHIKRNWKSPVCSIRLGTNQCMSFSTSLPLDYSVYLCASDKQFIYFLLANGMLLILEMKNSELCTVSKDIIPYLIPTEIATPCVFNRNYVIMTDFSCFVISNPWSSSISIIPLNKKKEITKNIKCHSCPITNICGHRGTIVTGSTDSSVMIINLQSGSKKTILPHTSSISALAVSETLGIIVSCDICKNLVISDSQTGAFIRHSFLDDHPSKILISELGFIIVLYDIFDDEAHSTKITLIDLSARILKEGLFEGNLKAATMISLKDSSSYIAIALQTMIVHIIRVYDLEIVSQGTTIDEPTSMTFFEPELCLIISLKNGQIMRTKL